MCLAKRCRALKKSVGVSKNVKITPISELNATKQGSFAAKNTEYMVISSLQIVFQRAGWIC
jgi:hypothetical protein